MATGSRILTGLLFLLVGAMSFGTPAHVILRERDRKELQQHVFFNAELENINDGIVACDGRGTLS